MNKKSLIVTVGLALLAAQSIRAASTTVTFDSGDFMLFDNPALHSGNDVALSGGNASIDGDGDVLQLGYYTGATSAGNNFTGTWVPLSGQGSLNTAIVPGSNPGETYAQTSIGDRHNFFAGDGTFALSLTFSVGDPTSGNSLPAAGTILSIRLYNGTTLANSTFYNTVSDNSWAWVAPTDAGATLNLSLNDPQLLWESIVAKGQPSGTAFHTTIPIPEPSSIVLLYSGLITAPLFYWRRRKAS
jgi:hypothetical protein